MSLTVNTAPNNGMGGEAHYLKQILNSHEANANPATQV